MYVSDYQGWYVYVCLTLLVLGLCAEKGVEMDAGKADAHPGLAQLVAVWVYILCLYDI